MPYDNTQRKSGPERTRRSNPKRQPGNGDGTDALASRRGAAPSQPGRTGALNSGYQFDREVDPTQRVRPDYIRNMRSTDGKGALPHDALRSQLRKVGEPGPNGKGARRTGLRRIGKGKK